MIFTPALRARAILLAVVLALLVSPAMAQTETNADPAPQTSKEWIVQLDKEWARFSGAPSVGGALGDSELEILEGIPDTYLARFNGETTAADAVARLANSPAVAYIEPDILYEYQEEFIPDDQYWEYQKWAETVNLPGAWAISGGESDMTVAIVDSGIRVDHPDLQGKVTGGYNFVDENHPGDITDYVGHGTSVAGIVGAIANDGVGIAGSAMNVQLMSVKVGTRDGARVSNIARGITYAVNNGASVINLSLGSDTPSATLEEAIQFAYDKGVIVVAAAGNSRDKVSFPGTYPQTISVGASTLSGEAVADFSSRVSRTDIAAPGQEVVAPYWSEETGNSYVWGSGTSYATPIVAGTVAILKSIRPNLTAEQVRTILTETAQMSYVSDPQGGGAGVLDAGAAVQQVLLPAYGASWLPADEPVASMQTSRSWLWGPHAFDLRSEPYAQSDNGLRSVAYFDKARMEIKNPHADWSNSWYVTNGLLVNELITGRMQVGDNQFEQRDPAQIPVAGDPVDNTGPVYATFNGLLDEPALADGEAVTQTLDRTGAIGSDVELANYGVTAEEFIPETGYRIASVFWDYLTSSGLLRSGGQYVQAQIFDPTFFATGFPITNPYWSEVTVAGETRDVLIQCFERRCLTFTPSNAAEWQVEMGNVGLHYYRWRYGDVPAGPSVPDPASYALQHLR